MKNKAQDALPEKFTKKPITVEAIRWTGENLRQVIDFTGWHPSAEARWTWEGYEQAVKMEGLKIFTLEGPMMASIGDWIVKGVKGEFYPCKPDIFEATYTRTAPSSPQDIEGLKKPIKHNPKHCNCCVRNLGWNDAIDEMIRRGWRLPGDDPRGKALEAFEWLFTNFIMPIDRPITVDGYCNQVRRALSSASTEYITAEALKKEGWLGSDVNTVPYAQPSPEENQ